MIETFFDRDREDAHGDFQRWRARNWATVISTTTKVLATLCSTGRRELEWWASENATSPLKRCKECEHLGDV